MFPGLSKNGSLVRIETFPLMSVSSPKTPQFCIQAYMSLPFSKDVAIIIVRSSFKFLCVVQLKSFSEKVVSFCFSTLLFCFVIFDPCKP